MQRQLVCKVLTISLTLGSIISALGYYAVQRFLDVKIKAETQLRDSRQEALSSDFDLAIQRATSAAAAFLQMGGNRYQLAAQSALDEAAQALEALARTVSELDIYGVTEHEHVDLLRRQRRLREAVAQSVNRALAAPPLNSRADDAIPNLFANEVDVLGLRSDLARHRQREDSADAKNLNEAQRDVVSSFLACLTALVFLILALLALVWCRIVKPVTHLATAANRFAREGEDTSVSVTGNDEIGELQLAFNRMVRDRKRVEEELRNSREQLRQFAASLSDAIECERTRIARALHDEMGQELTALRLALERPPMRRVDAESGAIIMQMRTTVCLMTETIRRIVGDLRPLALDHLGIAPASAALVKQVADSSGLEIFFDCDPELRTLSPTYETVLYRSLQEALTNVAKHAAATKVSVALTRGLREIELRVTDNGIGFVHKGTFKSGSHGLFGLTERAAQFGGRLVVLSGPGQGTALRFILPMLQPSSTELGRSKGLVSLVSQQAPRVDAVDARFA
jgi:signal transduction histidine kinase